MVIETNEFSVDLMGGGSQLSLRYHARLFDHKKNLTEIIREIHLTEIVKLKRVKQTSPAPN